MSLASRFVRSIGYPLLLAYRGESALLRHHRDLRRFWRATPEQLERHRLERLRLLLRHAAATSPFHHDRLAAAGVSADTLHTCDDIRVLPLLDKNDLNQHMDRILSNAIPLDLLIKSSTGGSSGVPLTFYRDRDVTAVRRAQDYFFNARLGICPGTKRAWVWGSPIDVNQLASLKARLANFLSERAIYFYSFDADREAIAAFISQLQSHRPEAIFAYPNMLAVIAEQIRESGADVSPVRRIITTAEPTYDWQRELFRAVFGGGTYERYGSREIGTVAAEGPEHNGMVVFEPTYYMEVVDERGGAVGGDSMGELVVTDLYNFAMPLIRYRTGDLVRIEAASPADESCWRRITAVGGRVVDLIVRPDGARIAGEAIIMALRTSGFQQKVQVVQTAPQVFRVRHLIGAEIADNIKDRFKSRLDGLLGAPVTIEYQAVGELKYDKSGKYRYVTSECNVRS